MVYIYINDHLCIARIWICHDTVKNPHKIQNMFVNVIFYLLQDDYSTVL